MVGPTDGGAQRLVSDPMSLRHRCSEAGFLGVVDERFSSFFDPIIDVLDHTAPPVRRPIRGSSAHRLTVFVFQPPRELLVFGPRWDEPAAVAVAAAVPGQQLGGLPRFGHLARESAVPADPPYVPPRVTLK